MKTEGDGRSPAGVFELGAAFGYATAEEMKGLKISYYQLLRWLNVLMILNQLL